MKIDLRESRDDRVLVPTGADSPSERYPKLYLSLRGEKATALLDLPPEGRIVFEYKRDSTTVEQKEDVRVSLSLCLFSIVDVEAVESEETDKDTPEKILDKLAQSVAETDEEAEDEEDEES